MKLLRLVLICSILLAAVGLVSGSVSAQKFSYVSGIQI